MKDYNKRIQAEKEKESSGDEDSDLQWCDNVAYGSRENNSILTPNSHERQYNTVPHPSRAQKASGAQKKYATISATTGKQYNDYAEVGKARPRLFQMDSRDSMVNKDRLPVDGYEPGDSLSSLSSRSKDSVGSQGGEESHYSSVKSRIEYFSGGKTHDSPKGVYPASPRWRREGKSQALEENEPKAPLAKQEVWTRCIPFLFHFGMLVSSFLPKETCKLSI